jgi:flagellar basal-body rod modification protein FlgD
MITDVTASTTGSGSAASTMKTSLGMVSNDFLQLFIAQLQYQDPLAPTDATAMMNQLSQLTLVEQSYNTTKALNNLISAQNNATALSSTGLVGGTIRQKFRWDYDGTTTRSCSTTWLQVFLRHP